MKENLNELLIGAMLDLRDDQADTKKKRRKKTEREKMLDWEVAELNKNSEGEKFSLDLDLDLEH